jgi:hypothetical protein
MWPLATENQRGTDLQAVVGGLVIHFVQIKLLILSSKVYEILMHPKLALLYLVRKCSVYDVQLISINVATTFLVSPCTNGEDSYCNTLFVKRLPKWPCDHLITQTPLFNHN